MMSTLPSIQEIICDGEAPGLTLGLGVALAISELLGLTDRFRGNGLLHTVVHVLRGMIASEREAVPREEKTATPMEPMSPRLGVPRLRETSGDTIEETVETVTTSHMRTSSLHGVPKTKRPEGETSPDHSDF